MIFLNCPLQNKQPQHKVYAIGLVEEGTETLVQLWWTMSEINSMS